MGKLLLWMVLSSIGIGCNHSGSSLDGNPSLLAKGNRLLGMDTNDASSDFSFTQSFAAAQAIGVGAGTLHLTWSGNEGAGSGSTSGTFSDIWGALAAANGYYSTLPNPARLSLTLAPIDTGGAFLPSDLNGLAMNNPVVITRFNAYVDWILSQLPSVALVSLQIGNEIDIPAAAGSSLYWSQYKTFITAVVAHVHGVRPGLKVGVTVSLYGLIGQGTNGATAQSGVLSLLSAVDELGLTYYPMDTSFMMKSPSVVASDFADVFARVGTTPIYLQEVGYATSSVCGGTVANQADFIDQIFLVWDAHAAQIPFVSLLRMNDLSSANATSVASNYGLGGNAPFVAYLQTLGFRGYTAPTTFKSAWSNVQTRTHERGWW